MGSFMNRLYQTKKEYQGLKTRLRNYNIQSVIKKKDNNITISKTPGHGYKVNL
jgi:hypothetical protein